MTNIIQFYLVYLLKSRLKIILIIKDCKYTMHHKRKGHNLLIFRSLYFLHHILQTFSDHFHIHDEKSLHHRPLFHNLSIYALVSLLLKSHFRRHCFRCFLHHHLNRRRFRYLQFLLFRFSHLKFLLFLCCPFHHRANFYIFGHQNCRIWLNHNV